MSSEVPATLKTRQLGWGEKRSLGVGNLIGMCPVGGGYTKRRVGQLGPGAKFSKKSAFQCRPRLNCICMPVCCSVIVIYQFAAPLEHHPHERLIANLDHGLFNEPRDHPNGHRAPTLPQRDAPQGLDVSVLLQHQRAAGSDLEARSLTPEQAPAGGEEGGGASTSERP